MPPSQTNTAALESVDASLQGRDGGGARIDMIRNALLPRVTAGFDTVARFQAACGLRAGRPTNPVLHALFTLGAALGNENMFIMFLPALFWAFDVTVARRLIIMWCAAYFIGQGLKDILKLPRPPEPTVTHVEKHYSAEYGMPSTHATNCCSMPWFIVLQSWHRLPSPSVRMCTVAIATVWCIITCLSRLYMGVHCPLDIVVGSTLGFMILATFTVICEPIDLFIMSNKWSPVVAVVGAVVLMYLYPRPQKWVNSPGDCGIILGVAAGVVVGCYFYHDASTWDPQYPISLPTTLAGALWLLPEILLGVVVLFVTRAAVKPLCIALLVRVLPPRPGVDVAKRYDVELPTKLVTYSCIGFNAVLTVPWLARALNIR